MANVDGKTITECFSLVSRFCLELNSMMDTLSNQLLDALRSEELPCKVASEAVRHYDNDESDYVVFSDAINLPLKQKGKGSRNAKMYLGFQASMAGDSIKFLESAEPLLYVFCWTEPVDFNNLSVSKDDLDTEFEVIDERLIIWGNPDGEWDDREWLFAVNLTALNTPSDLQNFIVKPAIALLRGARADSAISTEWLDKEITRMPKKDRLVNS